MHSSDKAHMSDNISNNKKMEDITRYACSYIFVPVSEDAVDDEAGLPGHDV